MTQDINIDIEAQESAFDDVVNSAQKVMKKNGYVEPLDYVEGNIVLANNTERKHSEIANSIFTETQNESLAKAVADIETGIATMDTTDLFLPEEKENRAVFENVTGEALPTTNVETRQYLLDRIGKNLLKSAEEETMYRDDVLQGEQLAEVNNMGPIEQSAFISGYEKADNKDEYRSLFNHYYKGGRNNLGFETVANMNPVGNENVAIDDRYQMYNAGLNDSVNGEQSMANRIAIAINKAKASDIKLMSKVANRLGINIEITDNEGMQNKLGGEKQFSIEEAPNGFYENGKVVINIEADKPLSAIFSHELTHELKEKNPEAYKQFRDFVVEAWKNRDAESLAEEINSKIEHYKANGVELTEEEAIEEILADSTWELVQNEDIINELCRQNRSLAQFILDAIEKVIEKIKVILTGNVSLYEPRIEKKLYEELGIAEEVAKMWVDGISNQVKNIENKNLTYDKDIKFSIKDNYEGPDGKIYDQVVILDTDIFKIKKNKHKSRSAVLKDFVYEKLAGHKVIAYDGDKPVAIEFARENERVIKDGVDKNHKVIDKLARKKQDRDRHIIVHAKELVEVSKDINASNSENSHQWLDKNGWDYRKVYIVNHRGDILEATLNIANTKDGRKVLYDINKIRPISLAVVATKASRRNIDNSYDKNISVKEPKSKSFSLKEPVEVGDKLIAMHNITPDKLWKALKLGGFPMPSLAVTKAKIGHTNFGDISLLFDKSTIDPETDSRNKVYGADAWTPVFPQIDYKLNEKKADEVYDRANKAGDLAFFNPVSLASTNLESKVKDVNGDSLVEHFKNDYGLKNMYLAEKGEPVKMLFEEKDRGGDIGKWFAENCKNEVLEYNKIENNPEDETQYVLDNKEKLSEVYANYLRKVKKENEEYITKRINRRPMLLIGVKNGLMSGMDSLEGKKDIVEDIEATEKLIDDKVNQADYEKWIKDLFAGIVEKEGVHNGKDPYTASGNRRSFEKLHYDVTLDNIVQAMIGQADNVRNDSAFFNGLKTIRAVATEDFGSLEDIRNGKNKLRTIDDDNYELLYNNLSDELADIISKIASKTYGSSNDFIKQDAIGMNIADAILAGNTTAEGLKKYLNKYGSKVTVEDTKLLENLIREVANMPVNMFEAKLERSVRFDEVVGAVVPADIDKDLISALEEEGVEVSKYESDEDRIDTVNRLADKKNIMFSIKDSMTEKDYYHYGWAIVNKILDKEETASFLKQIGDLKRGNYYVRNYEGLIIIPVYNKMGISNKLVYTDGRYQNPSIEKILNISYKQ